MVQPDNRESRVQRSVMTATTQTQVIYTLMLRYEPVLIDGGLNESLYRSKTQKTSNNSSSDFGARR